MRKVLFSILLALSLAGCSVVSTTKVQTATNQWADVDGEAYVIVGREHLSVNSLSDFFYFDEVFKSAMDGVPTRLCVGEDHSPGMAAKCLGEFDAVTSIKDSGKNRSLTFLIPNFSSELEKLNSRLHNGGKVKISIDNGKLFSAYDLHKSHKLKIE